MISYKKVIENISVFLFIFDVCFISLLGWGTYVLYFASYEIDRDYQSLIFLTNIFSIYIFQSFRLYNDLTLSNYSDKFFRSISSLFVLLFFIFICLFCFKSTATFSRYWMVWYYFSIGGYLVASRFMIVQVLKNIKGTSFRSVLLIGNNDFLIDYKEKVNRFNTGYHIENHIDLSGKEVLSTHVSLLVDSVDEVWISYNINYQNKIKEILYLLRHKNIIIRYIPEINQFRLLNSSITEVLNMPLITLSGEALSPFEQKLKRAEDIILSLVILTLISPLFIVLMLAVKLTSRGPIFYKQYRHGFNGKIIKVYKFRSMYKSFGGVFKQATKNDSRITPLGKILRKTSLDELPQFVNVVQGRMSIVGPRPHAVEMNEQYKDVINNYMQRHKVKPGITGWAQINGLRGETDQVYKLEQRVNYDLYYIENWSLAFDFRIIIMTIFKGFVGKNTY